MRIRAGAGIALLGLALVLVAGLFDAEPLYVPGIGLVALAAGAWTWVALAAREAAVSRELSARRVQEGEPVEVVLRVRTVALPLPGGAIRDPLLPRDVPLPPLRPVAGEETLLREGRLRLSVSFARRGRRSFGPPGLALADPFGLAARTITSPAEDHEILVLPRVEPVEAAGGGGDGGLGQIAAGFAAAVEVDGIRPYREGAPANRIHWPAVARGGELMERRLSSESDARPIVVLDARAPDSEAALDAAVRAAASLAHALALALGCALFLPGERRPADIETDLGAWPLAHARLALVVAGGTGPVPASGAARRGAVLYVAARTLTRLPPAWAAVARGPRFAVGPEDPAGERAPAFTVAGCAGYALRSGSAIPAPTPREAVA